MKPNPARRLTLLSPRTGSSSPCMAAGSEGPGHLQSRSSKLLVPPMGAPCSCCSWCPVSPAGCTPRQARHQCMHRHRAHREHHHPVASHSPLIQGKKKKKTADTSLKEAFSASRCPLWAPFPVGLQGTMHHISKDLGACIMLHTGDTNPCRGLEMRR